MRSLECHNLPKFHLNRLHNIGFSFVASTATTTTTNAYATRKLPTAILTASAAYARTIPARQFRRRPTAVWSQNEYATATAGKGINFSVLNTNTNQRNAAYVPSNISQFACFASKIVFFYRYLISESQQHIVFLPS